MRRAPAAAALLALAAACAHRPSSVPSTIEPPAAGAAPTPRAGAPEVGMASFYGRRFHGRRTASGERYDMRALTCEKIPGGATLSPYVLLPQQEIAPSWRSPQV